MSFFIHMFAMHIIIKFILLTCLLYFLFESDIIIDFKTHKYYNEFHILLFKALLLSKHDLTYAFRFRLCRNETLH